MSFSLFWSPSVRKSATEGRQRMPNVSPMPPKAYPGTLKNRRKIDFVASGVPGLSWEVSGYPPGSKRVLKIIFRTTWGISHKTKKSIVDCRSLVLNLPTCSDLEHMQTPMANSRSLRSTRIQCQPTVTTYGQPKNTRYGPKCKIKEMPESLGAGMYKSAAEGAAFKSFDMT